MNRERDPFSNAGENSQEAESPDVFESAEVVERESRFEQNMQALQAQSREIELEKQERAKDPETKKWFLKSGNFLRVAIATGALSLPFLTGCGKAENPNPQGVTIEKSQEAPKADSEGFIDSPKNAIKNRLDLKRRQIDAARQPEKATPQQKEEARKAINEMKRPLEPQESNPNAERPNKDTKPGPSGKVSNPDNL